MTPHVPTVAHMVDTSKYESIGHLDEPFRLTKKHDRLQRERVRMRESLRCELPPLTYEDYRRGAPCPGCGRPYRDPERWEFRGTMHMNPEERLRYDAEQELFASIHPDCHSIRHTVSGSLTTHCGKCCPSPPLSPSQIAELSDLFARREPTPPHLLMRWRLRLYCGHTVEKQAHYSHRTVHSAFTGLLACTDCGLDPATVVDARAIGLAGEPPTHSAPAPPPQSRPKAALEARVRELEAELNALRLGNGEPGDGVVGPAPE
jgi:hypothetical protein